MSMTQEGFDALVQKLECYARNHPKGYKLRVGLLAGLGYGYIFLAFLLLLAIASFTILLPASVVISAVQGGFGLQVLRVLGYLGKWSIVLVMALFIPAFMVVDLLRSLWVHFPKPTGLKLHRQDAPELFGLINELTTALNAPPPNHVLVTPEFNAGVLQRPRLGLLGWYESYLMLGLPLMQAITPQQFRAILAHEFGHLSGNHSRFAGWIYRQRIRWFQLRDRFQANGGASLFNRFLRWYAPFFHAYSFVLARMDEYEADRCAANLAGARSAAEALVNVEVKGRFIQQSFWSEIYGQVADLPDPPAATYSQLLSCLQKEIPASSSHEWLAEALNQKTNNADTHPCLSDRLQGLGLLEQQPIKFLQEKIPITAADYFLGHIVQRVVAQFDQDWQNDMSTSWRQRFAHLQTVRQQLQTLEEKSNCQPLTVDEEWERAYSTLELQGVDAGIPLIQHVLTLEPTHVAANYMLGQLLLQQDDRAGVAHLEMAMAHNPNYVLEACQFLYDYFWQKGEPEIAENYQQQATAHYALLEKAQQERSQVSDRDQFKPHTLTETELDKLRQQLMAYPDIKAAYLVEKVVQYFPDDRFLVLGVVRKQRMLENSEEAGQNLIEKLIAELEMPNPGYIILLNHPGIGKLKKVIPAVERSQVLPN